MHVWQADKENCQKYVRPVEDEDLPLSGVPKQWSVMGEVDSYGPFQTEREAKAYRDEYLPNCSVGPMWKPEEVTPQLS